MTRSVSFVQNGNKYCHNLWLSEHLTNTRRFKIGFRFERSPRVENRNHIREFFNVHFSHMIASTWLHIWKLDGWLCRMTPFWPWRHHQQRHNKTLHIARFIHIWEMVALGAISKAQIMKNNAGIVITFLGYTQLKNIFRNNTSQNCRSKVIFGVWGWSNIKMLGIIMGMLLWQPRFYFTSCFHDR